jgi:SAM-dependent methyltransferase
MGTYTESAPAELDDVRRRVQDMYSRFPYPSLERRERRLGELANMMRLFAAETPYDFRGKTVLDVGTGTGHRLISAARHFPDTRFVAVDACDAPLEIARATALEAGVTNVTFQRHDLLADGTDLGRFDAVLCMGVLHHLSDPALGLRRLTQFLADDGVLFAYLYGAPGSAERMRRKEMLSLLVGDEKEKFETGIRLAKALRFASDDFGWNRNSDDTRSLDALIVDRYLNVHEVLFDTASLSDMMRSSDLDAYMVYGITSESRGYLFDTELDARTPFMVQWTDMTKNLPTAEAVAAYRRLDIHDKYRMVELAYQPNGYTVLGYRHGAAHRFARHGRIGRNSLLI